MVNVIRALADKYVLIISDNDTLAQVIALSLSSGLRVKVKTLIVGPHHQPPNHVKEEVWDLIVIAMSSPANEPVIALARASLGNYIGHTPILIISDKAFQADLGVQIAHLDFPFVIEKLNDKVSNILHQQAPERMVDFEQHDV